jgi:hypothetical protein
VWAALALAAWIVGLSYIARRESRRGPMADWPLAFLAVPGVLAVLGARRRPGQGRDPRSGFDGDLDGVEPRSHPRPLPTPLRPDRFRSPGRDMSGGLLAVSPIRPEWPSMPDCLCCR